MKYSEEQKKILVDGFRDLDFTKDLPLQDTENLSPEQQKVYAGFQKQIRGWMKSNFPDLGITRQMDNFSHDHPVNLMTDADARYIAKEATEIASSKKKTVSAIFQYFKWFGPLISIAVKSYCRAKGKKPRSLKKDDWQEILADTTKVINEELLSAVMQGQQFSELNEVAHETGAHEDFDTHGNWNANPDAINFHVQWTHCKTKTGEMLSLDDKIEESVSEEPEEEDILFRITRNEFCDQLDDVDATIFRRKEDGYTNAEIAEELNYKTPSAVTKRLQTIRRKWDEFMDTYEPKK